MRKVLLVSLFLIYFVAASFAIYACFKGNMGTSYVPDAANKVSDCACPNGSTDQIEYENNDDEPGTCVCPEIEEADEDYDFSLSPWCQDNGIFVYSSEFPFVTFSRRGITPIGDFTFVNCFGPPTQIKAICVQSIGKSPLDSNVESLTFDVVNWERRRVEVVGPWWPKNGKVCVDVDMTVDSAKTSQILIGLHLLDPLSEDDEYGFAITSPNDVQVDPNPAFDQSQPIVGDFPIEGSRITVVER